VAANATIALVNIPMLQGRTAAASANFEIARRAVTRDSMRSLGIQIKLPEQSK
jgi:hypothetical protein